MRNNYLVNTKVLNRRYTVQTSINLWLSSAVMVATWGSLGPHLCLAIEKNVSSRKRPGFTNLEERLYTCMDMEEKISGSIWRAGKITSLIQGPSQHRPLQLWTNRSLYTEHGVRVNKQKQKLMFAD